MAGRHRWCLEQGGDDFWSEAGLDRTDEAGRGIHVDGRHGIQHGDAFADVQPGPQGLARLAVPGDAALARLPYREHRPIDVEPAGAPGRQHVGQHHRCRLAEQLGRGSISLTPNAGQGREDTQVGGAQELGGRRGRPCVKVIGAAGLGEAAVLEQTGRNRVDAESRDRGAIPGWGQHVDEPLRHGLGVILAARRTRPVELVEPARQLRRQSCSLRGGDRRTGSRRRDDLCRPRLGAKGSRSGSGRALNERRRHMLAIVADGATTEP